MYERIMSRKKFWIIRFRDADGLYDYVVDVGSAQRRKWWHSSKLDNAHHFKALRHAKTVLKNPVWAERHFDRRHGVTTEIIEVISSITETWTESQIITDESPLIQLARTAEDASEYEDNSEDTHP